MASWQPMSKPTTWQFNVMLSNKSRWCLDLIINLLCHVNDRFCCLSNVKLSWQRHWQVMCWFMSRYHNKDISNYVIFAVKISLLSKWHTFVTNMQKPSIIFITYVMIMWCVISWLCDVWLFDVSLMHTPSSKVLPKFHF